MRPVSATALALVLALALASAESRVDPPAYELKLVSVGEEPTEYLFVVGTSGFRSVETLKAFLERLPAGTRLTWSPGCIRSGNEPLLSSEYEMEEFRRFCAERGIDFVLVPSG